MGKKKEARPQKSKEQILAEMRANVDFQKKIAFVKEKFYPALCEASDNIEDALVLLVGFNNTIMQSFLGLMKEKKIVDLNLESKLDASSDKFIENRNLLELFNDLSVFDAKDYIEGMKNEIEMFKQEEFKARPLSSLKTKWIDEV